MESRVFDAAIALYAAGGWSNFTLDGIARVAGVGKSSLYSRWKDRADLLQQTLAARWARPEGRDTGSLRGDLTAFATDIFDVLAGPFGSALLHMRADSGRYPDVRRATQGYSQLVAAAARRMVRRAIDRGELPAETSTALMIDLVVGPVLNRFGSVTEELRPSMIAKRDKIIGDLVAIVVRGASAGRAA